MLHVALLMAHQAEERERLAGALTRGQRDMIANFVEETAKDARHNWERLAAAHAEAQLATLP